MLTFKVVFGAATILIFVLSVWLNISLYQERKELETALEASQSYAEELKADIRKQADVLFEREQRIDKLANDKARLNRQLKEMAKNDEEVKLWIDTRIPDAVIGMLRTESGNTDTASTAPTVP